MRSAQHPTSSGPRLGPPLERFVAIVVASSVIAFAVAARSDMVVHPGTVPLLVALAVLVLASEFWSIPWHPAAGDFALSWGFAGALAIVAPPVVTMAVVGSASVVGGLWARHDRRRIVFGAASSSLSIGAGAFFATASGLCHELLAADPEAWVLPASVVLALLIISVYLALTLTMVHLDGRLNVRTVLRSWAPRTALDSTLLLFLAPVFCVVGQQSLALIALPILAVVGIHRSARMAAVARQAASLDPLTGLVNRDELVRQVADRSAAAVIVLDIDGFRRFNERLGHEAGDHVLTHIGDRLRSLVDDDGVAARLAADRFAVLLPDADLAAVGAVLREVRRTFSEPFLIGGVPMVLAVTTGWATSPVSSPKDATSVLDIAQKTLQAARVAGSAGAAGGTSPSTSDSLLLLRELQLALASQELHVEFQPQVDMVSGSTMGFEALVRWNRHGVAVSPSEFVLAAEHTELIWPLTELVLDRALSTASRWWRAGSAVPVAVNFSASSLTDMRLVPTIKRLLARHELPGEALEVEITESVLVVDSIGASAALRELASMGVKSAIDDFGTGYSSFAHLRDLPVSRLKIDRSFVAEMSAGQGSRFVAPIIDLGHNLGLEVVAEGVETAAEHDVLIELGCELAQGWYYAPSLSDDVAVAWAVDHMPMQLVRE